ncbi:MAG: ADP-ribosylation factor-like protein [Candidatus Hodarchaeales archaeon]
MEDEIYISWLGLAAAGKSTLIKRVINGIFIENLPPTLGVNMDQLPHMHGEIPLISWDVGGQITYRDEMWKPYISQSAGCAFVIDSTDRDKIPEVKSTFWNKLIPEILSRQIPLVILANKQDLESPMSTGEIALALDLHKLDLSYMMIATSAKTGEGLDKALNWLYQIIEESRDEGKKVESIYDDLIGF